MQALERLVVLTELLLQRALRISGEGGEGRNFPENFPRKHVEHGQPVTGVDLVGWQNAPFNRGREPRKTDRLDLMTNPDIVEPVRQPVGLLQGVPVTVDQPIECVAGADLPSVQIQFG